MPATRQMMKSENEQTHSSQGNPLAWPALDPLVPSDDLYIQEIYPSQIVTIPGFWTQNLCRKYVSFLSKLPLATTSGKPQKGNAPRVNDRYHIDDADFAQELWERTGLKQLLARSYGNQGQPESQQRNLWVGEVIGLNQNIRIYRCSPGQFFDKHCKLKLDRGTACVERKKREKYLYVCEIFMTAAWPSSDSG